MQAQTHQSDPRILSRRTLQQDHRLLAEFLRPGLSVLDVGCGTGAITAGIAKAVGPYGRVIGIDRDPGLLNLARAEHGENSNLQFENVDATDLPFHREFEIVTAARTLQWISEPGLAISQMTQAGKSSGMLVVLDYNHAGNDWLPDPPAQFRAFYAAFLAWRQANHWDNEIADHLPALFRTAQLVDVESHVQDEVALRGEPGFVQHAALWVEVIQNIGRSLAEAGFATESELREASECYQSWVQIHLMRQSLQMRTVVGRVA